MALYDCRLIDNAKIEFFIVEKTEKSYKCPALKFVNRLHSLQTERVQF